ncbi:hypothetical protein LZ32DRAFT_622406 [Colletotrichum eremochloae]|nr:hypothetical protein LZ32DRAFT_622406 [Colletotrichum eremochloae]
MRASVISLAVALTSALVAANPQSQGTMSPPERRQVRCPDGSNADCSIVNGLQSCVCKRSDDSKPLLMSPPVKRQGFISCPDGSPAACSPANGTLRNAPITVRPEDWAPHFRKSVTTRELLRIACARVVSRYPGNVGRRPRHLRPQNPPISRCSRDRIWERHLHLRSPPTWSKDKTPAQSATKIDAISHAGQTWSRHSVMAVVSSRVANADPWNSGRDLQAFPNVGHSRRRLRTLRSQLPLRNPNTIKSRISVQEAYIYSVDINRPRDIYRRMYCDRLLPQQYAIEGGQGRIFNIVTAKARHQIHRRQPTVGRCNGEDVNVNEESATKNLYPTISKARLKAVSSKDEKARAARQFQGIALRPPDE